MTAQELISYLQDFDPETEVRIGVQPNWPFQHELQNVISKEDLEPETEENIIYLLTGDQLDYFNKEAWEL